MTLQPADPRAVAARLLPFMGEGNALLAAGTADRCNPMTIGWLQTGRLWNLPVCTVYVRPERYTYQFMEENSYFTVSAFLKTADSPVKICGTKSGRDMDKVKECGLTVQTGAGGAPFFAEAELVLVCKTLYVQDMDPACVRPAGEEAVSPLYGKMGGWHRIYTGEIVEAYEKR